MGRDASYDQIFDISADISITESEIVFAKNSGNPASTAVLILSSTSGASNSVSVNDLGIVDVN